MNNASTIKELKESYCMGDACLIVSYGDLSRKIISFYSKADLKRGIAMVKELLDRKNKKVVLKIEKTTIVFHGTDFTDKAQTTSERQAKKFYDVLSKELSTDLKK